MIFDLRGDLPIGTEQNLHRLKEHIQPAVRVISRGGEYEVKLREAKVFFFLDR